MVGARVRRNSKLYSSAAALKPVDEGGIDDGAMI
jgi:hypothetical protein